MLRLIILLLYLSREIKASDRFTPTTDVTLSQETSDENYIPAAAPLETAQ